MSVNCVFDNLINCRLITIFQNYPYVHIMQNSTVIPVYDRITNFISTEKYFIFGICQFEGKSIFHFSIKFKQYLDRNVIFMQPKDNYLVLRKCLNFMPSTSLVAYYYNYNE